jgi:hypothetical protein
LGAAIEVFFIVMAEFFRRIRLPIDVKSEAAHCLPPVCFRMTGLVAARFTLYSRLHLCEEIAS